MSRFLPPYKSLVNSLPEDKISFISADGLFNIDNFVCKLVFWVINLITVPFPVFMNDEVVSHPLAACMRGNRLNRFFMLLCLFGMFLFSEVK